MSNDSVTFRKVLKYSLLPGILPRLGALGASGFGYIAFFIAQLYSAVRLLPGHHPYLSPANIGRYGVRHVIAEAANNLVISRDNTDQIIMFGALLFAMVILVMQFVALAFAILVPSAAAAIPYSFSEMFVTQKPAQDLAFIMMDRVFGVPGLFNSCVSTSQPCLETSPDFTFGDEIGMPGGDSFPWPFHVALHGMFQFYSIALLVVGVMIFLYFIVAIVAETAQTGTPFGKRFNSVWAPIRLVTALGLLIPLGSGLNSAQYITLYSAKWGSSLATNAWVKFNETLSAESKNLINKENMIAKPNDPDLSVLLEFIMLAKACKFYEETYVQPVPPSDPAAASSMGYHELNKNIEAYLIRFTINPDSANALPMTGFTGPSMPLSSSPVAYDEALEFFNYGDIVIRFGDQSPKNKVHKGNVFPHCGEIVLSTTDLYEPGAEVIRKGYYEMIKLLWNPASMPDFGNAETQELAERMEEYAENFVKHYSPGTEHDPAPSHATSGGAVGDGLRGGTTGAGPSGGGAFLPHKSFLAELTAHFRKIIKGEDKPDCTGSASSSSSSSSGTQSLYNKAVCAQINEGFYDAPPELLERGWGAAGVWYNRIAQMNGALIGAAWAKPTIKRYPWPMEQVLEERRQHDEDLTAANQFSTEMSNGEPIPFERTSVDKNQMAALGPIYDFWRNNMANETRHETTGIAFLDAINFIFGTEGLFNIRENDDIHPLAQLTTVGKSLIESTIRNLMIGGASGLGQLMGGQTGAIAGIASSFLFTVASVGLTAGFVLFYVIPFLPFIYFFFAVTGWVKGIFEAMVGVPLWALAHIRIDGQGLPGEAAINGYYLIFEIFLRPILVVFGMLAGITIFAASAQILNDIFDLVTGNLSGHGDITSSSSSGSGTGTPPSASGSGSGSGSGPDGALGSLVTTIQEEGLIKLARGPVDQLFYLILYTIIIYMMAISSFKMVDLIPKQILRWMGTSVSTFGDQTQDAAGSLVQYAAIGGGVVFGQVSGAAKQIPQGIGQIAKGAGSSGPQGGGGGQQGPS